MFSNYLVRKFKTLNHSEEWVFFAQEETWSSRTFSGKQLKNTPIAFVCIEVKKMCFKVPTHSLNSVQFEKYTCKVIRGQHLDAALLNSCICLSEPWTCFWFLILKRRAKDLGERETGRKIKKKKQARKKQLWCEGRSKRRQKKKEKTTDDLRSAAAFRMK